MRLVSTILIGVLGLAACSKSKNDNPDPKDPIGLVVPSNESKVLPLDGAKWNSFMSIPWEKRCEGIEDVLGSYQRNNLPGFVLTPLTTPGFPACIVTWGNIETSRERYEFDFRLSKDGKDFDFHLQVSAGPEIYRSIGLVNLDWKKGDVVVSVEDDTVDLIAVHPNFQHLDKTLDAWYLKEDVEAKIFGRPYAQYLSEISTAFGETGGFILKNPNIKMKLTLDRKVPGKGTAEFIEVDEKAFSEEQGPFLGCKDMNCIKGSTVRFQALGTKFLFDREIETQAGTTFGGTWHYPVKSWPLILD